MIFTWQYSVTHDAPCKVIEEQTLWGRTVCRVWLPNQDAVVRIPHSALRPLDAIPDPGSECHRISYIAAAAKVAGILEGNAGNDANADILLAPMESNVIPLPHQIDALFRAIYGEPPSPLGLCRSGRVRYLLADEVGLGKTIEAGLIMRELKLRGMVSRTLVVTPKSLAMQWVAEMDTHFNETFALINPGDLDALERLECPERLFDGATGRDNLDYNPWLRFPQAIVTLDAVKPLARRKGWSREKIQAYNQNRFARLIQGQWDLIIVDESHRLGGSSDQVARFKLGQGLAEAAPYLLLLSATPHQGKSDAFHRLMSLLDPMTFPDADSVTHRRVREYVIRTEKRKAVTAEGQPLFLPRTTVTQAVDLEKNPQQVALYDAVTDYVKAGYNRALKDRKPHIGFLMVLLQRIVTSSTCAIRCTLERRLHVLQDLKNSHQEAPAPETLEEFMDMDGQQQLDMLVEVDETGRVDEIAEVERLLELARRGEAGGPDVKMLALMELIFQLQGVENDDQLKLLIFTEFVPTQAALKTFLEERGIACATLNGSMSMDERRMAQWEFRDKVRVLVSTDAGGEGLNLQFCHVVVNFDLPWNPMRIEQRIGRVDRIGQKHVTRAVNFVYENSVESRVREVLEEKLAVILSEMGIDKANDVLDTSLSGEMIEKMMTHVIMENADPEAEVNETVTRLQQELREAREECPIYKISRDPDMQTAEKLRGHPLPHWVERMTVNYLKSKGCRAEKDLLGWRLDWPDGKTIRQAVFQPRDLDTDSRLLSLENPRVRGLALNLPRVSAGQRLPVVSVPGLPETISGFWGLFEISLATFAAHGDVRTSHMRIPTTRRGYATVFLSDEGKVFLPTARHIWDALQSAEPKVRGMLEHDESLDAFNRLQETAEQSGQEVFDSLQQTHLAAVKREEERGVTAFSSRRKAIERVGLPEVRQYRLGRCDAEETEWRHELQSARQIVPEIRSLLLLKIEGNRE